MIYTVTLNPAIDKTVVIENFRTGAVNRVTSVREDAGGKGINVSKCLKNLGAVSVAAVILAGSAGDRLEGMLREAGIQVLQVRAEGQSRTNLKIIDPVKKENTDINYAFIQFDVVKFKLINDTYGEAVGTELLHFFQDTLGVYCHEGHLYSRLTADVFMVVTPYNEVEDIYRFIRGLEKL